jgi:hypothetical protein
MIFIEGLIRRSTYSLRQCALRSKAQELVQKQPSSFAIENQNVVIQVLGTIGLGGLVICIRMRFIGLSPVTIARTFRKNKRNLDIRTINEILGEWPSLDLLSLSVGECHASDCKSEIGTRLVHVTN